MQIWIQNHCTHTAISWVLAAWPFARNNNWYYCPSERT